MPRARCASGARGYVSKSAGADELVTAVKKVAEGGRYVEREIAGELAFTQLSAEDPLQQLTMREIEILRLLGEGNSLTEIAQAIGVAYKTVANTCCIIKSKLGRRAHGGPDPRLHGDEVGAGPRKIILSGREFCPSRSAQVPLIFACRALAEGGRLLSGIRFPSAIFLRARLRDQTSRVLSRSHCVKCDA